MQSPVLSKNTYLQTSTNTARQRFPIREASQQGQVPNKPSTRCSTRPLLLFPVGRTCGRAEDNVAQPRLGGSCRQRCQGVVKSVIQTGISPLDAPDQGYMSRAFLSVFPIVNRCWSEWVSRNDTQRSHHSQSVATNVPRFSLNSNTSGGTTTTRAFVRPLGYNRTHTYSPTESRSAADSDQ